MNVGLAARQLRFASAGLIAAVLAGVVLAAAAGGGAAWDGADFLFQIIDQRWPYIIYGRWANLPVQSTTLGVALLSNGVRVPLVTYGLLLGGVQALALYLSWRVVRSRWPEAMVWPALAIGFAALPGQYLFQSEAQQAVALAWPVLLGLLVVPERHRVLIAVGTTHLFFLHPLSAGLFLVFAVASLTRQRRLLAVLFLGLAVARFLLVRAGYESQELTPGTVWQHFSSSVGPRVLRAILGAWFAGGTIWLSARIGSADVRRWAGGLAGLSLTYAAYELIRWASDLHAWSAMNDFRTIVPFAAGPIYLLAIADQLTRRRQSSAQSGAIARSFAIAAAGLTFAVVLGIQSHRWTRLTGGLLTELQSQPKGCVSAVALDPFSRGTPLGNWTMPFLAIMLQGRQPEWVLLPGSGCADTQHTLGLAPWIARPVRSGWFDLTAAQRSVPSADCTLSFLDGWYDLEAADGDRWRWSGGRGSVAIKGPFAGAPFTLSGVMLSFPQPNDLTVAANDHELARLRVTGFRTAFGPIALPASDSLRITFASAGQAMTSGTDPRALAIGLMNLKVANARGQLCAVQ